MSGHSRETVKKSVRFCLDSDAPLPNAPGQPQETEVEYRPTRKVVSSSGTRSSLNSEDLCKSTTETQSGIVTMPATQVVQNSAQAKLLESEPTDYLSNYLRTNYSERNILRRGHRSWGSARSPVWGAEIGEIPEHLTSFEQKDYAKRKHVKFAVSENLVKSQKVATTDKGNQISRASSLVSGYFYEEMHKTTDKTVNLTASQGEHFTSDAETDSKTLPHGTIWLQRNHDVDIPDPTDSRRVSSTAIEDQPIDFCTERNGSIISSTIHSSDRRSPGFARRCNVQLENVDRPQFEIYSDRNCSSCREECATDMREASASTSVQGANSTTSFNADFSAPQSVEQAAVGQIQAVACDKLCQDGTTYVQDTLTGFNEVDETSREQEYSPPSAAVTSSTNNDLAEANAKELNFQRKKLHETGKEMETECLERHEHDLLLSRQDALALQAELKSQQQALERHLTIIQTINQKYEDEVKLRQLAEEKLAELERHLTTDHGNKTTTSRSHEEALWPNANLLRTITTNCNRLHEEPSLIEESNKTDLWLTNGLNDSTRTLKDDDTARNSDVAELEKIPRHTLIRSIRCRSAPAARNIQTNQSNLITKLTRQGDYRGMSVYENRRPRSAAIMASGEDTQLVRKASNLFTGSTSCITGSTTEMKIMEVDVDGKFIRLVNTSDIRDVNLGGYALEQLIGNRPIALFRFPARIWAPARSTVTVWAGNLDEIEPRSTIDFVLKDRISWTHGRHCITSLCRPNGRAIAWHVPTYGTTGNEEHHDNGDYVVSHQQAFSTNNLRTTTARTTPVTVPGLHVTGLTREKYTRNSFASTKLRARSAIGFSEKVLVSEITNPRPKSSSGLYRSRNFSTIMGYE